MLRKSLHSLQNRLKPLEDRLAINPNDREARDLIALYTESEKQRDIREANIAWKNNNLEYDLRHSDRIAQKCKVNSYAQNLYAAICNNKFVKNNGTPWSCTWRLAAGLVADIRESGDYLDWYRSGSIETNTVDIGGNVNHDNENQYVSEGTVTDQIRIDLAGIGWIVL